MYIQSIYLVYTHKDEVPVTCQLPVCFFRSCSFVNVPFLVRGCGRNVWPASFLKRVISGWVVRSGILRDNWQWGWKVL